MADGQPTIPSDMVAVYDNALNQWWLYYISTDSQIKVIQGPKDGELEDLKTNPPYSLGAVDFNSTGLPSPKAGNSQLGVAEYIDNSGNPQTRIYYLDSDNSLCELGWNRDKQWFKGALTAQEYEAAPGSVITVAVTKEQLKVYYRGKDKANQSRLWVAWVTKGEEAWARRPIMSY